MRRVRSAAINEPEPAPLRFSEVYRQFAPYVWRVGRGLGVSQLDIDDVVHDVFLVVRRRLHDFDPTRSMRAWLAGITRRVVGHLRRKHAREARRLRALPTPAPDPMPDEIMRRQDAQRTMLDFLDGLDPAKRIAFVLMEIEGLTANEVAEVCKANPRTVYSRCRVAKERFAAYVAALEEAR